MTEEELEQEKKINKEAITLTENNIATFTRERQESKRKRLSKIFK